MSTETLTLIVAVFAVGGLVAMCTSIGYQQQACRDRGMEPFIGKGMMVACEPKVVK